jgi:phosphatidate cytidylyltransferase
MAFNKTVFKTRALTALVFVLVMLLGLLINGYLFFLLFLIIHCGAWWELFNLSERIYKTSYHLFLRIGFMMMGAGILLKTSENVLQVKELLLFQNGGLFTLVAGFLLSAVGVFKSTLQNFKSIQLPLLGFLYISISIASLYHISGLSSNTVSVTIWLPVGVMLPLFVIACMWINDTMAYLVGSFIGKTPLSKISPKKTWEGTIGGILLCGLVVGFAMRQISQNYFTISLVTWMLLACLAAILGTIGDLFESKLKRMADVKDSGSFMPGHGGFLDRFDSLLFATPFLTLIFYIILK